jgi:SAM-dependent methyltransferase
VAVLACFPWNLDPQRDDTGRCSKSAQAAASFRTSCPTTPASTSRPPLAATDMPFPTGTFDVLWTVWVIEYLPNPEKALLEIRRVVKPGGYL